MKLGFAADEFSYAIDLGLPIPQGGSLCTGDPEIKAEALWLGTVLRPASTLK